MRAQPIATTRAVFAIVAIGFFCAVFGASAIACVTIPTDVRVTFAQAAPHENSNFRTQPGAPSPLEFLNATELDAGTLVRSPLLGDAHDSPAPRDAHEGGAE